MNAWAVVRTERNVVKGTRRIIEAYMLDNLTRSAM